MNEEIAIARAFAKAAHREQVDKNGEDYFGHVERVAGQVRDDLKATAFLHDVMEDCGVTAEELADAGISSATIHRVEILTHRKNEPREEYYERVWASNGATEVKIADILDNTDPRRLAKLDDETIVRLVRKYAKALDALS